MVDAAYSKADPSGHFIATGTTIQSQLDALDSALNINLPVGTILPFGGSSAPTGYVFCQGQSVLKTGFYANLFSVIGTAYGTADGTHFNIPDLRGQFLRGVDGGSGRDPDASSRTAMNLGGATGNNVGSIQPYGVESHSHTLNMWNGNTSAARNPFGTQSAVFQGTYGTSGYGGNETRPLNAYVNYIIKY
jgi:microcystin-dependent protein